MWLTIVLERHLLPGSNLKIRFNAPSPGFAFQQRECTTSWREFLWKKFLLGENLVLAAYAIKILLPGRILGVPILQGQCSCLKNLGFIQITFTKVQHLYPISLKYHTLLL